MQEKVYIEYCTDCRVHSWSTNHDESKYLAYFERCKQEILEVFPEMTVIANAIPPGFAHYFQSHKRQPQPWAGKTSFPRIGAFEVYYQTSILFSKLCSGMWPKPCLVQRQLTHAINKLPLIRPNRSKSIVKETTPVARSRTANKRFRSYRDYRSSVVNPILSLKKKNRRVDEERRTSNSFKMNRTIKKAVDKRNSSHNDPRHIVNTDDP